MHIGVSKEGLTKQRAAWLVKADGHTEVSCWVSQNDCIGTELPQLSQNMQRLE